MPKTGAILTEYCIAIARPAGAGPRLPDADDVLAKWMLLTADERALLEQANMHMPGRQVDPEQVRSDLARLAAWERTGGARVGVARRRGDAHPLAASRSRPQLAARSGPR